MEGPKTGDVCEEEEAAGEAVVPHLLRFALPALHDLSCHVDSEQNTVVEKSLYASKGCISSSAYSDE